MGGLAQTKRAPSCIPSQALIGHHPAREVMIVDANAAVRRVIKQIFGNLADVIHECSTPVAAFADYWQCHRAWS